jgi:hypothetical protein
MFMIYLRTKCQTLQWFIRFRYQTEKLDVDFMQPLFYFTSYKNYINKSCTFFRKYSVSQKDVYTQG